MSIVGRQSAQTNGAIARLHLARSNVGAVLQFSGLYDSVSSRHFCPDYLALCRKGGPQQEPATSVRSWLLRFHVSQNASASTDEQPNA